MDKVSVIIPVYNVEELLPRCIESILGQTKKELEIILVDDGATDGSGRVCDEYAKRDDRIRVLHKKNGGLTSAWKAGVRVATGTYVGFVDSDDWIDEDMYEQMYASAKTYDSDVVICGLVFDYEDPSLEKRKEISGFTEEFYDREALTRVFPVLINDGSFFGRTLQPARVTKLYRRTLVEKNMEFCDERVSVGEDMQLTLPVLMDATRVSVVRNFYPYHYWYNQKSMTGSHDPKYLEKIRLMRHRLTAISREKQVYDFTEQLTNDFLGLVIIGIKSEVLRNPGGTREILKGVRRYLEDPEVREAEKHHTMNQLPVTIRVFLVLMQLRCCRICMWIVKLFFQ